MKNDLRLAFRLFARDPRFTAAVVITLALGIGSTTATFSLVNAVLLTPLPFPQPERIVAVRVRTPAGSEFGISGGVLRAVNDIPVIEHAAAMAVIEENLTHGTDLSIVRGALVTAGFFDVFKAPPLVGRVLSPDAGSPEIVIGEHLWRRRFGADPGIVGRRVQLNDRPYVVAGVMPRGLAEPESADYWRPLTIGVDEQARLGGGAYTAVARLRSDSLASARGATDALSRSLAMKGEDGPLSISLTPLLETLTFGYDRPLWSALAAVTLVLLMACGNVAYLLLARTAGRVRELTIRAAVGATRARIVRQLLIESTLLATAGAIAGLFTAWMLIRAVPAIGSIGIPRIDDVSIDSRAAGFAVAIAAGSVVLFGLVPAWLAARDSAALNGTRSTASRRTRRAAAGLVSVEIGVTLVLLLGSAVAGLALYRTLRIDVGFDMQGLRIATTRPSSNKSSASDRMRTFDLVVSGLRQTHGIDAVAGLSHVPLDNLLAPRVAVTTEDGRSIPMDRTGARLRTLSPGSLEALGVRLSKGRDFSAADGEGSMPVVIVNETLARRLWPDGELLGQPLRLPSLGPAAKTPYTVIGVARDIRGSLTSPGTPELYLNANQRPLTAMHLVVRSSLDAASLDGVVRRVIASVDPMQPVTESVPMTSLVWEATEYRRFCAGLLTTFAAFALALGFGGILAVVMGAVTARTREMGIRSALGARPGQLVRLVLRDLMIPVTAGVGAGLAAAYGLSTAAARLLAVSAFDAPTTAVVTGLLIAFATFAAWLPARRAGRVDPTQLLQAE